MGTIMGMKIQAIPAVGLVGNTPLLELSSFGAELPEGVRLFAKAEHLNPGGSVKDRAALGMVLAGERSGLLTKGKTILDATSGNTGIAYSWIGASRGYKVTLCLPANASPERQKTLQAYGTELILTDARRSTDGSQMMAKELAAAQPDRFFYPDQYNNDANWRAHFEGTGPEIWQQTGGAVTHFVAGIGTSGTFIGTARYLKQQAAGIKLISMQPASPIHGLEGMKHLETAIVPGIYDPTVADECVEVFTEDAYAMCRRLARQEGLFVGPSSGGNVVAALDVAKGLDEGVVVTILCDGGDRYLSERFWTDEPWPVI
ncbi:MAG: cysteine synthase family protein [Capsulimonadaceae bacterium]|nr:cysteine synthase family protein [Capsulimonadaceae bacterium]